MPRTVDLRLGIDVGGTHTDAVVLDRQDRVLAASKVATTPEVTSGIASAIAEAVGRGEIPPHRITHVMLGTTHATNAILEQRDLQRVAVVRIGSPATHAIPPLATWPDHLRRAVSAGEVIVRGGLEFDGRELTCFDPDELARFLATLKPPVDAVAVTSVFAPVSDRHERAAEEVVRRVLGEVPVSLSAEVGSVGLLERENATVLNAVLMRVARRFAEALERSLAANGIDAVTYFTQNDGTLMALDYVLSHPVLTIGSGPANSMRGAAHLTGLSDAVVADIGGTSTDVGALTNGFPRQSAIPVEVCGIRTNFRMPDILSIPLGGGTRIHLTPAGLRLGPDSVGYRLRHEACSFGGRTPTITDAAVFVGRADLGLPLNGTWPRGVPWAEAMARVDETLAEAVDRVKMSRRPVPLVVVGGGSIIAPDRIPGVGEIVRPPHFEVANAIGAAIAPVSGQVERIYHLGTRSREAALAEVGQMAVDEAIRAGADPQSVQVVDIEELTIAYLTGPALRIRARAAGALGSL
ncbi:MAG TPA: hydantoinase/oxoprolinase family protein [Candidatus Dormibacteraeota bacterium]|nr:hydantoinase/oxoprolinase family protein [Candidatus Dormibacteraeota bacterium]